MDIIGSLLFFTGFLGIIVFIILGLISLFRKNHKAKKNFILSGVSFGVLILALIILPPADDSTTASTTIKSNEEKKKEPLTLTMNIYSGDVDHDRKDANISGVTNKDATVTVNGETVKVDDKGKFSKIFTLKDGKNDFTVLVTKDDQEEIKNITINRETEEQMKARLAAEETARKEAEAKKKAEEEAAKKKAEEEKAKAAAAEAQRKKDEAQKMETEHKPLNYPVLKKNPDSHAGEKVKFTGEVIEILEQDGMTFMRIAVTKTSYGYHPGDIVFVEHVGTEDTKDIVEESIVKVYGSVLGSFTYKSQAGWDISLPEIISIKIIKQ